MSVQFNEKEQIALRIAGAPDTMEDYLGLKEAHRFEICRLLEKELLGPGLDDTMDLNEYGVALRSALEAIAHGERERFGPPVLA